MSIMPGLVRPKEYLKSIKDRGPVVTVELEFPIFSLEEGGEVNTISFREPMAGDIYLIGNPVVRVDYTLSPWLVERDQRIYFDMMAELSGIPVQNLMRMAPTDVAFCEVQLDRFFCPGLKTRVSVKEKDESSPPDEQPGT